ncbi:MAG: aminotransferase class V-fold PLP-dependent enzyme, partial [Proteobacteria bacterium]|nr:aminotransferase class V-fold PLP-dependent enzyme [Pseudomonadota bacterium]
DRAREALAAFVGTAPARLVFVPNATTGVAIALHSLALTPADRVLTTDLAYRASRNQLDRTGATIDVVAVPLPFEPARLIADVLRAITPTTRVALLDHITSATALRLPLESLVPALRARGVATIVDGPHAPGQIELDVDALGATYYVGAAHKWLCAPKGSAFLALAPDATARPIVTSHGASPEYGPANRLHAELDWMGTCDPTAYLCTPTALHAVAALGGSWPALRARNHTLILAMRDRFVAGLGPRAALSKDDALGAMVALPITTTLPADELQTQLLRDGYEVPIITTPTGVLVRLSAHVYNELEDVDALVDKLRRLGVR